MKNDHLSYSISRFFDDNSAKVYANRLRQQPSCLRCTRVKVAVAVVTLHGGNGHRVTTYTNKETTNSMVRVHERTIPTERPPLVGEVIANFLDKGATWSE
jgi:hypothetical protein